MGFSDKCKMAFRKIAYPNTYSSEALISLLKRGGGVVGDNTFIYASHKHRIDVANARYIEIGSHCLITEGVVILAHDYSFSVIVNKYKDIVRKQRITHIGNNVFIGMNSVVLMGADIGDNVIIGAGSVVSGKVESDSVYAGNPARKICTLDSYHEKLKRDFIDSAKIYASKVSNRNAMGLYRCLFEEDAEFDKYIDDHNFNAILSCDLKEGKRHSDSISFEALKGNDVKCYKA